MATVYRATQPALARPVAIKVLHSVSDQELLARFRREARSIAQLPHQNILPVYDYGEHEGHPYFVTQYVQGGRTLGDYVGHVMSPLRALDLAAGVLDALSLIHGQGIIHRDVKPTNILLPSLNWPLLADFGIIRLLANEDQRRLEEGLAIGTPAYMAPEQALGLPVDARTDMYSLGVVLYELLTGTVPFATDTPTAVLAQHAYQAPRPPSLITPDLPWPLEELILRSLAKDPAERFQSSRAMRAAVARLAADIRDASRPPACTDLSA